MATFTIGDIDRLGDLIRKEELDINEDLLIKLQNYRTSYNEPLAQTFNFLCKSSKKIHSTTIVSYRIKRFESIISKLNRYPEMRFSRMWDIAGCRCIVKDDKEVFKFRRIIKSQKELQIIKEYDYIKKPKDDGYRSLHIFVKHSCSDKIVEIQLRSQKHHNWATLVEISDLLFDSRLKEFKENKDLLRFHFLLSKSEVLTIDEKYEVSRIINKYDYFGKLSEVFSRNYLKVRRNWYDLETKYSHKYFMIETKKDDVPRISSFQHFSSAEVEYFKVYRNSQNSNIVLTHLNNPTYKQISIAYSNYILTFHNFLFESMDILGSLVLESIEKKRYRFFILNLNLYHKIIFKHIENFTSEIKEIGVLQTDKNEERTKLQKAKEKEWIEDLKNQINQSNFRTNRLQVEINQKMPKDYFNKLIIKQIIKYLNRVYRRKVNKLTHE